MGPACSPRKPAAAAAVHTALVSTMSALTLWVHKKELAVQYTHRALHPFGPMARTSPVRVHTK